MTDLTSFLWACVALFSDILAAVQDVPVLRFLLVFLLFLVVMAALAALVSLGKRRKL